MSGYLLVCSLLARIVSAAAMAPIYEDYSSPSNGIVNETLDIGCSFLIGSCGWQQEASNEIARAGWVYSWSKMALELNLNPDRQSSFIPKLVSPKIHGNYHNYCMSFDQELEGADIYVHAKYENGSSSIIGQANETIRIFAVLPNEYVKRLFLEAIITDESQFHLLLNNFVFYNPDDCLPARSDYESIHKNKITYDEGSVVLLDKSDYKECTWVEFSGTFDKTPDIIISTKWSGVRANVEYQNHKGFEVCAYEQIPLSTLAVQISWRANVNVTVKCHEQLEHRCGSGECVPKKTFCDGHTDCLSGDDETTVMCAGAMSQLAFATFACTVMTTYLVTYMRYIHDMRQMTMGAIRNEESRLEEINMRELRREASEQSHHTVDE